MQKNLPSIPKEIFLEHLFPFIPHSSLVSLKTSNSYFNKIIWEFWVKRKTSYTIPFGIRSGKFKKVSQCFISKLSNLTEIVAAGSLEHVDCGQELDDFAFSKMLEGLTGKVKRLDLVQCDSLSGLFLQNAIEMKLPLLHSLEELLLNDLDFEMDNLLLKEFINLKRLTLTGSNKFVASELDSFNFPTCLEKLVLDFELPECLILDIPNQCPNLTELHVKGVSDDVAIHLLVSIPKLKSFHIIQNEEESFIDYENTNKILSVFKKRGIKLNVHSLSLPYILCEKTVINPFGVYSEKLIELNLTLKGDQEEKHQDELLSTLLSLKNLKRLSLFVEEQLRFSNKVHSFSTNSTLKHLEYFHCTLTKGSGCLITHIVDSNLKEISLKGEESHLDFNFLNRCPNIEKIDLDLIVERSNLRDVIMKCKSGHIFSKLKHASGHLFTSDIVELFPNKESINTLYLNYKSTLDLKPFKFLKKLCLFMDERFPDNVILPVSLNSLKIISQNIETDDPGFSNNILALKNLRYLNLKIESLKDDAVIAICKKDSPIEELAICESKHITNSVTHQLSCMENLRNLFINECREFKDCNEISLLEHERNFHLYSSKLSDRTFDFSQATMVCIENLKNQSLSTVFTLERAEQLLKERKLFELNIITSFTLTETKTKRLSTSEKLNLAYYHLLSFFDQSCLSLDILISLVTSLYKQIPKLNNEQREKLRYCSSKSLEYVAISGSFEVAFILINILLELDDMESISRKISVIGPLMGIPQSIEMVKIFMEKCINIGRARLLQLFSLYDIVIILSKSVSILPIRSTPLFATFCRMIISTFTLNIDSSLLTDEFLETMGSIVAIHNPFSNISREIKNEKENQRKVDPLDESISIQEKIAIAVDPSWANPKDTHIECIDIDIDSNIELFKNVRSNVFEAFGFKWYLVIQNGEYLGEVTTSLHLDSTYPTNNNTQMLDYMKVRVLFLNFNLDPTFYFVRTHKFQFKDDFVSDHTHFEKDPFQKSEESYHFRTILGLQLIGMEMKPIPTMRNDPQISLSLKHPWLFKQISKERPISHQTISILTPIDVLEDDCFSSNSFNVFGNDIIFYIKPHSKKSGLFAIDISNQFDVTDVFKVKYFFSNESFEPDSVCIRKYDRVKAEFAENAADEKKDYNDVEKDFLLVEPKYYQPTIIEREQGKFFKKYVFQVVMVLGNTSQGLDTGDPFAIMIDEDDDDDWEDM